jgi:hypothetical protein
MRVSSSTTTTTTSTTTTTTTSTIDTTNPLPTTTSRGLIMCICMYARINNELYASNGHVSH